MKKYVFLTFAIFGIGGTQIYARNKALYLRKNGWEPILITTEPGTDIFIKDLEPFKGFVVPQLIKNPYLFSEKDRNKLLDKLVSFIGTTDDEIVIESNFIMVTLWGELLAKRLKARHLILLIQEDYSLKAKKFLRFFEFKYLRGEMAANTPYALKKLFDGYMEIPDDKNGGLNAICHNVIEDCKCDFEQFIDDSKYHIGSIGRINKPFVIHMVRDIVDFAGKNPDKTFQLVMFGGSPQKSDLEQIYNECNKAKNLNVFITGPIFPVPKSALLKMDVFVSSAGAARTSADLGCTTIAIDSNDFKPIGVLGYTTEETVHREPQADIIPTGELLSKILFLKEYKDKNYCKTVELDFNTAFDEHFKYFENATDKLKYYNVKKISPNFFSLIKYRKSMK